MPLTLITSSIILGGAPVRSGTILDLDDVTANHLVSARKAQMGTQAQLEAAKADLPVLPTEVS